MHAYVHMYTYMYVHTCTYKCMYIHVFMHVHMNVCMCMHRDMHVYVCYVFACVCVCAHMYLHVCVYMLRKRTARQSLHPLGDSIRITLDSFTGLLEILLLFQIVKISPNFYLTSILSVSVLHCICLFDF